MFQRKSTAIRYFGLDAADWSILILGLMLSATLMLAFL